MDIKNVNVKSNFNFSLFSKESNNKFCLANSLGVINVKVFVNLKKNFVTIKVGKKSVWKGNINLKRSSLLDFTEPNLDADGENSIKSVDGIIQHYTQDLTRRLSDIEEDEDEKEDIDIDKLQDKLDKFISQ